MKAFENDFLISNSRLDRKVQIWNVRSPGTLIRQIKRPGDSIDCFTVFQRTLFLSTTNKIAMIDLTDLSSPSAEIITNLASDALVKVKTSAPFTSNKIEIAKREVAEFFAEQKM